MKKKLRVNDEELVKALIYCKHKDGELCDMCSFGRFAPHCSSILLDTAVARIRELAPEAEPVNKAVKS